MNFKYTFRIVLSSRRGAACTQFCECSPLHVRRLSKNVQSQYLEINFKLVLKGKVLIILALLIGSADSGFVVAK